MDLTLTAILLGIVEGLTEFIPVSSTGHLILASVLFGYDAEQWKVFNVVIQLGAILAIVVLYWRTFWAVLQGILGNNPMSWRFVRNVAVGFLPSAIIGVILISKIELPLGNAEVVAWALIAGGVATLLEGGIAPNANILGCCATSSFPGLALTMMPWLLSGGALLLHHGFDADAFAAIGMTVTGLPALNAIRAVVDARPGVITSADMPLRAFAGRFKQ